MALRSRRNKSFRSRDAESSRRHRIGVGYLVAAAISALLLIDAMFGDRGLIAVGRASRDQAVEESALARIRQENAQLRDEIRRLKEDPSAIEEVARRDLGLIRPGEVLFVVKDVPKSPPAK